MISLSETPLHLTTPMASRATGSEGFLARIGRAIVGVFNRPTQGLSNEAPRVGMTRQERHAINDRYKDVAPQVADIGQARYLPGLPFYVTNSVQVSRAQLPPADPVALRKSLLEMDHFCGREIKRVNGWARSKGADEKPLRMKDCGDHWKLKSMGYRGMNPIKWVRTPPEYRTQEAIMRWWLEQRIGLEDNIALTPKAIAGFLSQRQMEAREVLRNLSSGKSLPEVLENTSSVFRSGFACPRI